MNLLPTLLLSLALGMCAQAAVLAEKSEIHKMPCSRQMCSHMSLGDEPSPTPAPLLYEGRRATATDISDGF